MNRNVLGLVGVAVAVIVLVVLLGGPMMETISKVGILIVPLVAGIILLTFGVYKQNIVWVLAGATVAAVTIVILNQMGLMGPQPTLNPQVQSEAYRVLHGKVVSQDVPGVIETYYGPGDIEVHITGSDLGSSDLVSVERDANGSILSEVPCRRESTQAETILDTMKGLIPGESEETDEDWFCSTLRGGKQKSTMFELHLRHPDDSTVPVGFLIVKAPDALNGAQPPAAPVGGAKGGFAPIPTPVLPTPTPSPTPTP